MDQPKIGRRYNDAHERIDSMEKSIVECSTRFSMSLESLSHKFESMEKALNENTDALRRYQEAGLADMVREHNEEKGFRVTSTRYGKMVVFVSVVGGAVAAIVYFLKTGSWPS